jgi:hypothetical protein
MGSPAGTAMSLKRLSRNSPGLAVALNCRIGSRCLKADVKAFDRLQIVRDRNSSYCGSNAELIAPSGDTAYSWWTTPMWRNRESRSRSHNW